MDQAIAETSEDRWVFAYGSLLWNPGFLFEERVRAVLRGYHRALCIYSHVHRGTEDRPGLVFGLDRGGACVGLAYRIAAPRWDDTLAYLRAREQVTMIYREQRVGLILQDGRMAHAVTYVVDRRHHQYAGKIDVQDTVRLVRQGVGRSGPNIDYVLNTHAHLVELGIRDAKVAQLAGALRQAAGADLPERTAASDGSRSTDSAMS
jgi:cation transport protein ChaC